MTTPSLPIIQHFSIFAQEGLAPRHWRKRGIRSSLNKIPINAHLSNSGGRIANSLARLCTLSSLVSFYYRISALDAQSHNMANA